MFGIKATDDEFERVFERFDTDHTYKLTLEEVTEAILEKKAEVDVAGELIK